MQCGRTGLIYSRNSDTVQASMWGKKKKLPSIWDQFNSILLCPINCHSILIQSKMYKILVKCIKTFRLDWIFNSFLWAVTGFKLARFCCRTVKVTNCELYWKAGWVTTHVWWHTQWLSLSNQSLPIIERKAYHVLRPVQEPYCLQATSTDRYLTFMNWEPEHQCLCLQHIWAGRAP